MSNSISRRHLGLMTMVGAGALVAGQVLPAAADPVDELTSRYHPNFRLRPLSADAIAAVTKPQPGRPYVDPAYSTAVYRATTASDGSGGRVRHNYSRRQAFNADRSRYLAMDGSGYWHLYDGVAIKHIKVLDGLAGDCEPLWHVSDPSVIYHTSPNGGLQWWRFNVNSGKREVLFDFTGKTPWPQAKSFWTKSEGTMSADGVFLALLATTYDEASQTNKIYGIVTVDLSKKKIIGTLDAKDFPTPHAFPDHISTSASGKFAVPSWLDGTWAYSLDFTTKRQLTPGSEHSDLAFGPNREDYLVYSDYGSGNIVAIDLVDGRRHDLHPLYPASGESYALHISGQCFGRPGWAVISTYADSADYANTWPAPTLCAEYRKVWLLELKPGGRKLNVAHIRAKESSGKDYFLEPQATASRDLTRIMFTSNLGDGPAESYLIALPKTALG